MKDSGPIEIPIRFHNESNDDCYFIIKELVEEFEGKFTGSGENSGKYKTYKKEKKSHKICLTDYNSLTAQYFCQSQYQTLLIILLKEFIKLHVNLDKMIKNVILNVKISTAFLNTQTLKIN